MWFLRTNIKHNYIVFFHLYNFEYVFFPLWPFFYSFFQARILDFLPVHHPGGVQVSLLLSHGLNDQRIYLPLLIYSVSAIVSIMVNQKPNRTHGWLPRKIRTFYIPLNCCRCKQKLSNFLSQYTWTHIILTNHLLKW